MLNIFYERLKLACTANNTTPTALAQKLEMSTGNVTRWSNGGVPSVEVLLKISNELTCSIDYLLGLTDNPEIKKPATQDGQPVYELDVVMSEIRKEMADFSIVELEKFLDFFRTLKKK